MANPPDEAKTYPVTAYSTVYPVPLEAIAVEFVTTTPMWVTGGLTEEGTVVAPGEENNVYILANTIMTVHFDQEVTPWFAVMTHPNAKDGFCTAVWHHKGDKLLTK
jgi:hypothetical protein